MKAEWRRDFSSVEDGLTKVKWLGKCKNKKTKRESFG